MYPAYKLLIYICIYDTSFRFLEYQLNQSLHTIRHPPQVINLTNKPNHNLLS